MLDIPLESHSKKKKGYKGFIILGVFFAMFFFGLLYVQSLFSPRDLDFQKTIEIKKGYSIISSGELLESEGIINSALAFRYLAESQNITVKSGAYVFEPGEISLNNVVSRLANSDYGDVYERLTIPEGSTLVQIAEAIQRSSFAFDQEEFSQLSQGKEGYLFPDTYNFLPGSNLKTIVTTLEKAFNNKIKPLELDIENSGRTMEDIIIMASLIEKEATGSFEEKKTVSGILWKRLDEGQLLQVDAPFKYINGVVRAADLRKDGPYNTYTRKGLTPTPIGNPGIDSIRAAINPTQSPYYYYLHGKDGVIRYGQNYNQHVNNINRYLR